MKRAWIIAITVLLGIFAIGGYVLFDSIFPKADPINSPEEEITVITIIHSGGSYAAIEAKDFKEILKNITEAQPTRRMSVNDYPAVKNYYAIEIDTTARKYRCFLYSENSQVYIEIPYEGIYKTDQKFLNSVSEYFRN